MAAKPTEVLRPKSLAEALQLASLARMLEALANAKLERFDGVAFQAMLCSRHQAGSPKASVDFGAQPVSTGIPGPACVSSGLQAGEP